MRILSLAVVSLALFAVAAPAEDAIPPEMVTAIKAATVFVKVDAGDMSGSGSGFVIKTDGDSAYVVTNHHVIKPKSVELVLVPHRRPGVPYRPPRIPGRPYSPMPGPQTSPPSYSYTPRILVREFKNAAVTVVFHSGTENEESVHGEVLAADPEQDLAVIKVSGVKKLPKPIDYLHEPKLSETTPVYIFGFPFGSVLATSKGGPAITVGKGSVSSLRLDDDGNLSVVQIDGALNPGNSGGPVVDAQGRLVGVAVATIRESTGIGLAIPCRELFQMLRGRPGKVYLHTSQNAEGLLTVHVEVGLIDPLNKIKSAELHYLAAKSLKDKPKPTDPLEPLPGCHKLPLKIENQLATGEFTLKPGVTEVSMWHQAMCLDAAEKRGLSKCMLETVRPPQTAAVAKTTGARTTSPSGSAAPERGHAMHNLPAPTTIAPPGVAAMEGDSESRSLPEPIDDVAAGGAGRYLLFHLRKLRKLAVFDVSQAKITKYLSLDSDEVLFAAGNEKLLLVVLDQSQIQRYDLATLEKELAVPLPSIGKVDGLALGHASAGPALLMTRNGPRFLDLAKLSLLDLEIRSGGNWWHPHPQYPLQVRASPDGSAFAGWEPGLSPSGIRLLTLQGDTAECKYEHNSAGVLLPSFDGSALFTSTGILSADLKPLASEQFRGLTCFPAYHPAYFLSFSGQSRISMRNRGEKPKLSLYTTADQRLLVSFTEFAELNDPQASPINRGGSLSIDKRVHFFPTANLLVNIPATRDQLVLHRLDVTAALEKAGIDYLYVASLPPAEAARGSTLSYTVVVKSRRGGVHCTLDSGPKGMTLSDDGKLQWSVPMGEPAGRQGVIITVKDASGQERLHSFNIAIR